MSISWLASQLQEGVRPSPDQLRHSLKSQLDASKRPDYPLCAAAAALLGDGDLWRELLVDEHSRDYHGYVAQRRAGVDSDDLGRYPTMEVSAERVRAGLKDLLEQVHPLLAQEIRDFVDAVSDF